MRVRTISTGLLSAAALVITGMSTGALAAATPDASLTASGVAKVTTDGTAAVSPSAKSKCKTEDGGPSLPDGIISWELPGSYDVSGAADFKCGAPKKGRTFKSVDVYGWYGDVGTTNFNVTIYGGKDEPDEGDVRCSTTGSAPTTGSEQDALMTITLDGKCIAKKGTNWLEVQATSAGSWYWSTQPVTGGKYEADWKDSTNAFGTGCTTYDNDRNMESCIFGGESNEHDFRFTLH